MRAESGRLAIGLILGVLLSASARADVLCDPSFQDCREPLLNLIRAEQTGIDVAFWFMEDARYSAELVKKAQQGVPVRVLVDTRANPGHPLNGDIISQLASAGIPIRTKTGGPILHWKLMLFAGLGQVEFSGANYSPTAFVANTPYANYVDEAIYFSSDVSIVRSFMRKFDDAWIDASLFTDYANVGSRVRRYALFSIAPELNFPPGENYRTRAVARYNAEPSAIDVQMFRITDRAHTDAMIAAAQRGVRVRIISDTDEYRNPTRMWHSWNLDRLYMAGIPVRVRAHAGLNHEKAVILRAQATTIFGSSNWTSPSADGQEEHNMFTSRPEIFQWFVNQFDRKWDNLTGIAETAPFVPLPPDPPVYSAPVNGATGMGRDVTLQFSAGPFAHLYDIYLGTSSDPPRVAVDVPLGPFTGTMLGYHVPFALRTGTTYYWRVVAKTMAQQTAIGPVARFTTAGAPAAVSPDVDGDGRADLTVWRPDTGVWFWLTSSSGYSYAAQRQKQWGSRSLGDVPLVGDVDGDGVADLIVWRASTGMWYWLTSSSGYDYAAQKQKQWGSGSEGDIPLVGDIDGDRKADLIVWRPRTGQWFWLTSSSGYNYAAQGQKAWGSLGDVPMLGDMDGDGRADLTVWRPASGIWFWLTSASGYNYSTQGQKAWGSQSAGDVPLLGDFDGDGRSDLAVWRATTGVWFWITSGSGYNYATQVQRRWGEPSLGDRPLAADRDGDGVDDPVIWRASTGTWFWLESATGFTSGLSKQWGASTDIPIVK